MAKVKIKVRPLNVEQVTEDVEDAIKRGITAGGGEVVDTAHDKAVNQIRRKNAISSGNLINSFETRGDKRPKQVWSGEVKNTADYAAAVEEGTSPTSYSRAPPIVKLVPWVVREMQGFTVPAEWSPSASQIESANATGDWVDANVIADNATLTKAFWLQEHIKETGTPAVRFMHRGRVWAENNADDEVAKQISAHFRAL